MKSVLVIGIGQFGRQLSVKMSELGNEVMVVDTDEEITRRAGKSIPEIFAQEGEDAFRRNRGLHK